MSVHHSLDSLQKNMLYYLICGEKIASTIFYITPFVFHKSILFGIRMKYVMAEFLFFVQLFL